MLPSSSYTPETTSHPITHGLLTCTQHITVCLLHRWRLLCEWNTRSWPRVMIVVVTGDGVPLSALASRRGSITKRADLHRGCRPSHDSLETSLSLRSGDNDRLRQPLRQLISTLRATWGHTVPSGIVPCYLEWEESARTPTGATLVKRTLSLSLYPA